MLTERLSSESAVPLLPAASLVKHPYTSFYSDHNQVADMGAITIANSLQHLRVLYLSTPQKLYSEKQTDLQGDHRCRMPARKT